MKIQKTGNFVVSDLFHALKSVQLQVCNCHTRCILCSNIVYSLLTVATICVMSSLLSSLGIAG
jgi:hypothetical protein